MKPFYLSPHPWIIGIQYLKTSFALKLKFGTTSTLRRSSNVLALFLRNTENLITKNRSKKVVVILKMLFFYNSVII